MSKYPFKNIAMISTHGYFDPVPKLGRTDTGGQVVYVLELAKAIARQGIRVDIFTRWFDKAQQQVDPVPDNPGVSVIRIHSGEWEFIPKEFIYDFLPELSVNMLKFIKENNIDYDLFHGHYVDAGIVTLDVSEEFKKPAFFTAHSLGAWKRDQMGGDTAEMEKKFNFKHRVAEEMRIFKSVCGQTLTSEVQKEKLNSLYNYDAENIRIIPPGVDIHRFKMPVEDDNKIITNLPEKYIFCLSRIDTNKGHDLLLKAFALVKEQCNDVHLVIGGGSQNPIPREQEVFENMRRICKEENLDDRVHFIGYVADEMMVPYYQQALLFVLPSLFEPFGMTTQEAMACGMPVIASKYGGIRNVITHGKDGMLVDSENREEFADIIIKLLNDEKLRKSMGQAAGNLIRLQYSWEAIADRFLDFYCEYI